MAACLRYCRRHRGLTGTNPSVGTLLVKDGVVVGRGITARGGRPHSERVAVDQAGENARGSTAYVSLEPCAHHGATPPCAQGLIDAGIHRVVTAWIDPDDRVDGKGHQMLRDAGIEVDTNCHSNIAAADLSGYLNRKQKNRPQVILKLAVSADGMLGIPGREVAITGSLARNVVHRMRAEYDAILVGRGTIDADDPDLTCRLAGLEDRSPHRFILDTSASLPIESKLAQSAKIHPVTIITPNPLSNDLLDLGVARFAAENHDGCLALPEIAEDMAAAGISTLMVEGGAEVARSFLEAGLIDEIALFSSQIVIGEEGIVSPLNKDALREGYSLVRQDVLGDDVLQLFKRDN